MIATILAAAALAASLLPGETPGPIHPWGQPRSCLSAPVVREYEPIIVTDCGLKKGEQLVVSTQLWYATTTVYQGVHLLVLASWEDPGLCAGFSPRTGIAAVLVDCATEKSTAIPLFLDKMGKGAYVIKYVNFELTLEGGGSTGKVSWTNAGAGNHFWAIPQLRTVR